jgi:hypothetical protein
VIVYNKPDQVIRAVYNHLNDTPSQRWDAALAFGADEAAKIEFVEWSSSTITGAESVTEFEALKKASSITDPTYVDDGGWTMYTAVNNSVYYYVWHYRVKKDDTHYVITMVEVNHGDVWEAFECMVEKPSSDGEAWIVHKMAQITAVNEFLKRATAVAVAAVVAVAAD